MPGPAAVPVRMTIKRERKLRQVISAGTSPQRLLLRARIILAAAAGDENAKIARDLGCGETTVREWRKWFKEAAMAAAHNPGGLRPHPPGLRPGPRPSSEMARRAWPGIARGGHPLAGRHSGAAEPPARSRAPPVPLRGDAARHP